MTVGELKRELENYDENRMVYIVEPNSRYAYSIDDYIIDDKGLASFYGEDKTNILFIAEGSQVGSMSNKSNLDLEE